MVAQQDPALRRYQRWFEIYLALMTPLKRSAAADDIADPMQDSVDPSTRARRSSGARHAWLRQ